MKTSNYSKIGLLICIFIILQTISCASSRFKTVSDELPGEGLHTIEVGDKECIIAQNDEDALAMECFRKTNLKHEVVIKRR